MNYRTISDLNQVILKRLHIIPRDIDLIVGIPRSGMFPAKQASDGPWLIHQRAYL